MKLQHKEPGVKKDKVLYNLNNKDEAPNFKQVGIKINMEKRGYTKYVDQVEYKMTIMLYIKSFMLTNLKMVFILH